MSSAPDWPFDQPRNAAAVTLRRIMDRRSEILVVFHDLEDDGWQFLDGGEMTIADAMLVGMGEIVARDSTILQLAAMPPGRRAERRAIGGAWVMTPTGLGSEP